jgi:hypothetical protein
MSSFISGNRPDPQKGVRRRRALREYIRQDAIIYKPNAEGEAGDRLEDANQDIKDKSALLDNRKLIETVSAFSPRLRSQSCTVSRRSFNDTGRQTRFAPGRDSLLMSFRMSFILTLRRGLVHIANGEV